MNRAYLILIYKIISIFIAEKSYIVYTYCRNKLYSVYSRSERRKQNTLYFIRFARKLLVYQTVFLKYIFVMPVTDYMQIRRYTYSKQCLLQLFQS